VRDGVDRVLVDLLSLYRDILMVQLGAGLELVNESIRPAVEHAAVSMSPAAALGAMDAISLARHRVAGNTPPALALEALMVAASGRVPALESFL
jgi:DNA polymerase-3 subunit delta'